MVVLQLLLLLIDIVLFHIIVGLFILQLAFLVFLDIAGVLDALDGLNL